MVVYFLTMIRRTEHEYTDRCVGFLQDLDLLKRTLQENKAEYEEGNYYNVALIEESPVNLHPVLKKIQWYAFEGKKWIPIEEPEWAHRITNFAIH